MNQIANTNDCEHLDNVDGPGHGTFFADDNPFSQNGSKRDSGRLCDFSGPLGEKIKESIMMHMSVESMDAYVEQLAALEGARLGSPRSSLGSPSAAPKALSKTCPAMHSSPAPRRNLLSVSVPALCSRASGPSPPSSPSFSCPPERKHRSMSPAASTLPGGLHLASLSASPFPPSPIPQAHNSEASSPSQKILSTSATSFSTFSTPSGALNGSARRLDVAVEREIAVDTHMGLESTIMTPEKVRIRFYCSLKTIKSADHSN